MKKLKIEDKTTRVKKLTESQKLKAQRQQF